VLVGRENRGARRQQHHHRLVVDAPRDELDRLPACLVDPRKVVHHADDRRGRSGLGDQLKRGQRDEEPLGRGPLDGPERAQQRLAVPGGQPVGPAEDRTQQVQQGGERLLALRQASANPQHRQVAARGLLDRGLQQRGLPHAGIADDVQRPAAVCDSVER
jgi:hypothetical protein